MGWGVSVCFYLIIGLGIAVALWLSDDPLPNNQRLFRSLTAPCFWPIYVPLLFATQSGPSQLSTVADSRWNNSEKLDGMATMILQVESELDRALQSLNGWAEEVVMAEKDRIAELRTAWRQQAAHVRELDRLLVDTSKSTATSATPTASGSDNTSMSTADPVDARQVEASDSSDVANQTRREDCERTRSENLQKLRRVRRHLYDELMAPLAWVRELVTMIHLAKYTGEPASRASELVQQIAAAIEGVSELSHHKL